MLWLSSLPTREHSFALVIRRTQAAKLKPDTFYGNLSLKWPASTWPPIQFNLFKIFHLMPTDHLVLLRPSGRQTLNMCTATISVRLQHQQKKKHTPGRTLCSLCVRRSRRIERKLAFWVCGLLLGACGQGSMPPRCTRRNQGLRRYPTQKGSPDAIRQDRTLVEVLRCN